MVEMYLQFFTSAKTKEWAQWILWAEFYYTTSLHSFTHKTTFKSLWSSSKPSLMCRVPLMWTRWTRALRERVQVLAKLIDRLKRISIKNEEGSWPSQNGQRTYYMWLCLLTTPTLSSNLVFSTEKSQTLTHILRPIPGKGLDKSPIYWISQ